MFSRGRFTFYGGVALLALVQGGLSTLALAPYNVPAVVWLVPWPLFFLARLFRDSLLALFLSGALCSFFLCLFAFSWILGMLEEFAGIPLWAGVIVFIPYAVLMNLKTPLFVMLFGLTLRPHYRRRLPATFLLAGSFALFCDIATPQIFPWYWGNLVSKNTVLLQVAEITGIFGLTFLLFAGSYWLYRLGEMLIRRGPGGIIARLTRVLAPRFWGRLAAVPATLLVVAAFGVWRIYYFSSVQESLPKIRVAAIQPNAPLEKGGSDRVSEADLQVLMHETIPALAREGARAAGGTLDLIVLPESSVPYYSTDDGAAAREWRLYSPEFRLMAQLLAYNHSAEVLLNEVRIGQGRDGSGRVRDEAYNSAVLVSRDGKRRAAYDKRELLAFGEYIPGQAFFEATGITELIPALKGGRYYPGASPLVLPYSRANTAQLDPERLGSTAPSGTTTALSRAVLGDKDPDDFEREFPADHRFEADGTFLPMICYEVILPHFPRAFFQENDPAPDFMVNITQDAWYGNGQESFQHYELGRARAVEYRRAIVRATNSGTSGFVDLAGRYATPLHGPVFTEQDARAVQVWDVPIYRAGPTFYARFGNAWMLLPFGIVAGWYVWRRGRESGRRGQDSKDEKRPGTSSKQGSPRERKQQGAKSKRRRKRK